MVFRVQVGHVARAYVQFEVWSKILEIIVVWQLDRNFNAKRHRRLVRPAARNIPNGVATSPNHHEWKIIFLDEFNTFSMSFHRQIKTSQPITSQ